MHIILYESSSKGGCYKYATELYKAYQQHPKVASVTLLLPSNSLFYGIGVKKILMADNKMGNKINFIVRHFVNPLILWFYLLRVMRIGRKQKLAEVKDLNRTFVLLNDFEQLSAPVWSILYRFTLSKQFILGVFLHDSNRDNYPPSKKISAWCMFQMLKVMRVALYHGSLPEKSYYKNRDGLIYLKVEHGQYELPDADKNLSCQIKTFTENHSNIIGILGHIRFEKNYSLLMQAIALNDSYALIIAGSAANSNISIEQLKIEASELGVSDRIMWINRYLTDAEMASVIEQSTLVALYYANTFSAQSGILNQVTMLRKPVIVSNLPNALTETVSNYNLGYICKADDLDALSTTLKHILTNPIHPKWDQYSFDVSWSNQVNLVVSLVNDHI